MFKQVRQFLYIVGLWGLSRVSLADNDFGFGEIAVYFTEPIKAATSVVSNASIVVGVSFLFAALLRYLQYRVNPLAAPISNVIFLLILGIVLVCLPLIYHFLSA